jgi:hypothetical protein
MATESFDRRMTNGLAMTPAAGLFQVPGSMLPGGEWEVR